MADDDDERAREFAEDTVIDGAPLAEAVPTPASTHDTTGKYKTLTGYSVSVDVQRELAFGRGSAHATKKVLTGLRLRLIASGHHPAVAAAQVEAFQRWMEDPKNAELIRVTMKDS